MNKENNDFARGSAVAGLTVSEAVFDFLRRQGVERIFGNPGSTELPMFVDLPQSFSYVLGLQESIVVGMADAYAQLTGRPAFVNLHSAAGLGHAMGNIYTAFRNRAPLVITTGQQTRDLLPHDPFLFNESPTEFPKPYVKWACEPARAEDVPAAIARAFYIAMQPPRGPVIVSIPLDDWSRPAQPVLERRLSTVLGCDPEALERIAGQIDAAKEPVLVVGPGVDSDDAWFSTVRLAEKLQAKVWVSPISARCSFPERHPLFAGFLPAHQPGLSDCLAPADYVLVLGAPVFTYHFPGSGGHLREGTGLGLISDDPRHVTGAALGDAMLSNIRLATEQLGDRVRSRAARADGPARVIRRIEAPAGITPDFLFQTLDDVRSPQSIIVEESPSTRSTMHDHFPIERPRGFFATASGGLGYGLPAAVGAALTRPEHPVILIIGDGSSLYAIQALWSAAEYDADLLIVVLNNGGYEALRGIARTESAPRIDGVGIGHIDFVAIAQAQGCAATRCERGAELNACLRDLLNRKGPRLLEVILSKEEGQA
ncbi:MULTISPECIES: benzoylformate decarboxylase [unclassified Beijerinckia]|uniref:benzoylformate decarboxylase n=1 Tax=unclassified Beijerinckia TaxID=2638183 RepID=UPI00089D2F02|nr:MULTISPECIES: benzoylformate decarboxylase [unclassified Beijerinckia]MDH7798250.1 thiamine pyrophosphate-dependent acetolactate synthase large subunit-like protein [Beijerinckia sp. GAS462]SED14420.1 benzoylformate decarboxylase [Beijerinckia sp. 28-YEA-48]